MLADRDRLGAIPDRWFEVEAVQIHHLGPGGDEVLDELLLSIGAAVDFRDGPELVTLIPRMAADASRPDKCLVFVPLQPTPSRTIRVITRKTSRLGPLLAAALKGAMTKGNACCVHEEAESGAVVGKAPASRRNR